MFGVNLNKDIDYKKNRELMVNEQIIARGITDKNVVKAMSTVPRHQFVPDKKKHLAYDDCPLPIGCGQTISQPFMVAIMTERLNLDDRSKVLEIGTGSGYQTAILAEIAKEVYTVERLESLSLKAQNILKLLGYQNIFFKIGDGTLGWEENSPYDGIIVTAAAPVVPESYKNQLKDGGRLVIPVGDKYTQSLQVIIKKDGKFIEHQKFLCAFVPLIGKEGWSC